MVTVAALVLGVVAWQRIPLDFIPEQTRPRLWVVVPYPNAAPQEVERRVVEPLEEELRTIAGMRTVGTTATRDAARFNLEFDWRTNMRVAYLDVRDRFETLRRTMPPEARRYFIWKTSQADMPIVFGVLAWPGSTAELFRIAETRVKPVLERLPGVAMVVMQGTSTPQVRIDLDQQRMQAHGVDPVTLIRTLREYHVSRSAGAVREGDRQLIVRTVDTYRNPAEVADIQVTPAGLRLRDVADVFYGYPEREFIGRINGANAVSFQVRRESLANTVETADRVLAALDALTEERDLSGFGYQIVLNQGREIRKAVLGLRTAGVWGGLLAVIILLLFLRRWRMTMLIAVAIPLSLLMCVASLYLLGRTLNIISLLGLMLAVGALVDNSVVVVENIVRLRQSGLDAYTAAARGASQVGLAIAAATATSIVVFAPLVFLRGEVRVYLRELGLALGLSLLASLIIALTLVPLAASRLLRGRAPTVTRFGTAMTERYKQLLRGALAHPWVVVTCTAVLLGITAVVVAPRMQRGGRPHSTMRQAHVEIRAGFPPSNLARTEALFAQIEGALEARRDELEIDAYFSFSGRDNDRLNMYVRFKEAPESETPVAELLDRLSAALPELPEASLRVSHVDDQSDRKTFTIRVRGEHERTVGRLVRDVVRSLQAAPGIENVDDGTDADNPELQLRVDRERIARAGLDSQSVGRTLAFALRGTRLPSLQTPSGEVEVWTQLEPEDRRDEMSLGDLRLLSPTRRTVALNTVSRFVPAPSPRRIVRRDGQRERVVNVSTAGMSMSDARKVIRAALANVVVPPGYAVTMGEKFDRFSETQRDIRVAVGLGIVLIYLVMAALFESLLSPLLIMVSVPFALVGSFWIMLLSGTELDVTTGVGLVLLIGIVANNGIVIVDRINQVRAEGHSVQDAVLLGGAQRLRPVLMTAGTTVLGLLPLAAADASLLGGEVMFAPVGRAVIGGLVTSTVLVLILVPFGYVLLARFQAWIGAVWTDVRRPAAAL